MFRKTGSVRFSYAIRKLLSNLPLTRPLLVGIGLYYVI